MTPEQLKQAADVMLAASRGETIQARRRGTLDIWCTEPTPSWEFKFQEYRVEPNVVLWDISDCPDVFVVQDKDNPTARYVAQLDRKTSTVDITNFRHHDKSFEQKFPRSFKRLFLEFDRVLENGTVVPCGKLES